VQVPWVTYHQFRILSTHARLTESSTAERNMKVPELKGTM